MTKMTNGNFPFVIFVPLEAGLVPEPNFPAQPNEFVGRKAQLQAFAQALDQGVLTGRTPSFAVLGEWGIGKSSLLLKYSAVCSSTDYALLPVFLSVSKELGGYKHFAESLLDTFAETLANSHSLVTRGLRELQNWKLKRLSLGAFSLDRDAPEFYLSSGSAILKHALGDAWKRFLRPANIKGVVFFLDDLHNLALPNPEAIALALRDQFQEFAIQGINYSLCFSARIDYFSHIRNFAEPAVRFYDKVYLSSFTPEETHEYADAVFGRQTSAQLSQWLYEKTLGHPYFLAFIARQFAALGNDSVQDPAPFWPVIFERLESEKFRSDLAHVSDKEIRLLRDIAKAETEEITFKELDSTHDRNYFTRLTEKALLIRVGRGRYRLYHPLFRLFLQQRR